MTATVAERPVSLPSEGVVPEGHPLAPFRDFLSRGELLARHSTIGIGGEADLFVRPLDAPSFAAVVAACRAAGIPWMVLGAGSNVLFDDAGFRGAVVSTERLRGIRLDAGAGRIEAESGARVLEVLAECRRAGLRGFEWADGIPGTVGGALVTNAGTALGSASDALVAFRAVDPNGRVARHDASVLGLGYRKSRLVELGLTVLSAEFRVEASATGPEAAERAAFAQHRKATQPAGHPNAGSIFRNPDGESAGRLIDRAGLKGRRIGRAEISGVHGNFIVNLGGASADDVRALMRIAIAAVREASAFVLVPEIVLMGTTGPRGLA